jgi:hypothetical protein
LKADDVLKKAVTLSVDEYTSTIRIAQNDPAVRESSFNVFHIPAIRGVKWTPGAA